MTSSLIKLPLRFILLVLLQVTIFNYVNFLGFINPYPYVMFVVLYPLRNNRNLFLLIAFLLGLSVDMFSDTGGIHAAASVFIAYIRPVISKFSFGAVNEVYSIKFNNVEFVRRLTYISLLVFLHHFMLFNLEIFNISHTLTVLKYTLFSGIFSTLLIILFTIIFSSKKN
jgi:rod shape-determining protein MreD